MSARSGARAYLLGAAALLLAWEACSRLLGPAVLPGVLPVLRRTLRETATRPFWEHVLASTWRVTAGMAGAFVTAVPLGLALGASRRLDALFSPLIYLTYPVPKIVLLPLVLVIFGLGDAGKIVLIGLIIFFQLLLTTRDSARQVGRDAVMSLKALGGTRQHLFRHVIWPSSLPGIFTSLRVGAGTAVAVLFFVESIGTRTGLGIYIIDAWGRADTTAMFAGMIALSVLGATLHELFDLLERRLCPWRRA